MLSADRGTYERWRWRMHRKSAAHGKCVAGSLQMPCTASGGVGTHTRRRGGIAGHGRGRDCGRTRRACCRVVLQSSRDAAAGVLCSGPGGRGGNGVMRNFSCPCDRRFCSARTTVPAAPSCGEVSPQVSPLSCNVQRSYGYPLLRMCSFLDR